MVSFAASFSASRTGVKNLSFVNVPSGNDRERSSDSKFTSRPSASKNSIAAIVWPRFVNRARAVDASTGSQVKSWSGASGI